ncbi:hypothetical protein FORC20_2623 [Salmonella enterica subsp. enterica serovar Typhimurium]|nr:hypothetical protein FORC20_2623 [Salmonella enterica subsp. enterica serovar Typhimurium]
MKMGIGSCIPHQAALLRGLFYFHLPDIRVVHFPDRGSYDNG